MPKPTPYIFIDGPCDGQIRFNLYMAASEYYGYTLAANGSTWVYVKYIRDEWFHGDSIFNFYIFEPVFKYYQDNPDKLTERVEYLMKWPPLSGKRKMDLTSQEGYEYHE